jgi:cation-transporting P-type ATPase 13A2
LPDKPGGDLVSQSSLNSIPDTLRQTLACCHALSSVGRQLAGDEVDLCLFGLSGYMLTDSDIAKRESINDNVVFSVHGPEFVPPQLPPLDIIAQPRPVALSVIRLLDFSSDLARQGSIAMNTSENSNRLLVFVKGAPETVAGLSLPESVPRNLDGAVANHAFHGRRVLALAYRSIECRGQDPENVAMSLDRCELERDLIFLGIVALENRVKADTKYVVTELANASLSSILVTGDHAATSLSVAKQCGIVPTSCHLVLQLQFAKHSREMLEFVDAEDPQHVVYDTDRLRSLVTNGSWMTPTDADMFSKARVIVTGSVFDAVPRRTSLFEVLLKRGAVFARMNPQQKTTLVKRLQDELGSYVLFCGDGANDVGALRAAHTGVAISSVQFREDDANGVGRKLQDDSASLASAFTSHCPSGSTSCVLEVLRQGRASSSASLAAFQFMILYSICQFVSVTLLYAYGSRVSDGQFLFVDLVLVGPIALLFSRSDATHRLARSRPPASIASLSVALPTIRLAAVQVALQFVAATMLPSPVASGGARELQSNVPIVSGMFTFVNLQYLICAVAINRGPHRQPLVFNRAGTVTAVLLTMACTALLALPSASEGHVGRWLEMVPLDGTTRIHLLCLVGINFVASFAVAASAESAT